MSLKGGEREGRRWRVAVVGATGNVGREFLSLLAARGFPLRDLAALATPRSAGLTLPFGEDAVRVEALERFDFRGWHIVLSSPGAAAARDFAPRAVCAGAVVIDNSSAFRMEEDVPLIVPEVNPEALSGYKERRVIANPNCSTIQMVVTLKPLHDAWRAKRVHVATYQSSSGAGREAMDELFEQGRAMYANAPMERRRFTKQIAFNVIPHIDSFRPDGATREEWKMAAETRKIMGDDIKVFATCVRVPVFVGHGEALHVAFARTVDEGEARALLEAASGVTVVDRREDGGYVTPLECAGKDDVYVGRVRCDPSCERTLGLWVVSDNLRKGAALNAVQVAELLVRDYL